MCACRHFDHPKQHRLYTPPLLELLSAQYFFLGLKAAATTMWATEHIISVLSKLKAQSQGFKGGHACSRHGHMPLQLTQILDTQDTPDQVKRWRCMLCSLHGDCASAQAACALQKLCQSCCCSAFTQLAGTCIVGDVGGVG